MDLTGATVEARSRAFLVPIVLALAGVCLGLAGAWIKDPAPAMLGVYPLVLAGLLWRRESRTVLLALEDRGLRLLGDGSWIPYDTITAMLVKNAHWSGGALDAPLVIEHGKSRLVLPRRLSVAPADLYAWLKDRVPPRPASTCPPALADYHAEQVAKFGATKVTLIARRWRLKSAEGSYTGIFLGSVFLTALAWLIVLMAAGSSFEARDEFDGWIAATISFLIGSAVIGIAVFAVSASRLSRREKAGQAGIVIGPAGMAMIQAEMKGSLRWDEVTGVTHSVGKPLVVAVRGARITIMDVYERSLADIAAMIRQNLG